MLMHLNVHSLRFWMICISILCFGHIANKFNVILSILKEVIIFPEKGDLFRIGKTNMNTLRTKYNFSFVEFPYEGKKLAAYAESVFCFPTTVGGDFSTSLVSSLVKRNLSANPKKLPARSAQLPGTWVRAAFVHYSRGPWPSWNTKYAPTKCEYIFTVWKSKQTGCG